MLLPQEGTELAARKPQYGAVVTQRLEELRRRWAELRSTAEEKGRQLFEAERAALYARSYGELESWLGRAQEELRHAEKVKDLTATNLLLKRLTVGTGTSAGPLGRRSKAMKFVSKWDWGSPSRLRSLTCMDFPCQRLEEQVRTWMKELEELGWQGTPGAGDVPDTSRQEQMLRQRVLELLEPLERKRKELETAKAMYQLGRDLEDETVSVLAVARAGGLGEPMGAAGGSVDAPSCSCGCRSGFPWRSQRITAPTSQACSA